MRISDWSSDVCSSDLHGPVLQPIPYGVMPRLGLAWVSTFAVRNKEREIPIGDSDAEYLRLRGMESDGRRYKTLRKKKHAWADARRKLGIKGRTYNENGRAWCRERVCQNEEM